MTSPFDKNYQPTAKLKGLIGTSKRRQTSSKTAEKYGLTANPGETRPFKERAAGKTPGKVKP